MTTLPNKTLNKIKKENNKIYVIGYFLIKMPSILIKRIIMKQNNNKFG